MSYQPMGAGGVEMDLRTGKPRIHAPEVKQAAAKGRLEAAVREAHGLEAELMSSPALRLFYGQCCRRLQELAAKDEVFQALAATIQALRHTLEIAPVAAENEVRRLMGPRLSSFIEEEAAPEGIPAE